jgi:flagellar protein FlbD
MVLEPLDVPVTDRGGNPMCQVRQVGIQRSVHGSSLSPTLSSADLQIFWDKIRVFRTDNALGGAMIQVTRLNHVPLVLNSDLIEHVEVTPDTVITLTTGQKILVLESADEIIKKTIAFRRAINARGPEIIVPAAS